MTEFFPTLALTTGEFAGQPFTLRSWQREIVSGLYREVDGRRMVRTALITMARKNGKTQLAAGLAAAHLWGPMAEARGEVYSAASDRNQSARIFRELEALILADPDANTRVNIQRFAKKIEVLSGPGQGSTYEALSSDAKKAHSLNPSFVVCDELAQWRGRELFDNLVTGTGARKQPLVVIISTMSSDPKHVMSELVTYGQQVNSGIHDDPSFAAFIYSAAEDAHIWDERVWYQANPALGDFRDLEEMRLFAAQAKRIPAKEAVFRNLYLNQPVERGEVHRLIPRADWDACAMHDADRRRLPELLKGRPCYGGLDLADKNDLTAFCLVFPFPDHVISWPIFWTREEGIQHRSGRDRAPYELWARQGHLIVTPGRVIDYEFVAKEIADRTKDFDLKAIACDPWQIEKFNQACLNIGADHLTLYKHPQGFKDMDPAVRTLEDLALKWTLRHDANPVQTWCNDNVRIVMDAAGNRKFDKQKATGRIDGIVALAMAANLAAASKPQEPTYQMIFL